MNLFIVQPRKLGWGGVGHEFKTLLNLLKPLNSGHNDHTISSHEYKAMSFDYQGAWDHAR